MQQPLDARHPAAPFQARFNHTTLSDGTDIRYFEQGAPSTEPILMLHGYSDSSFSFSRVLPLLPPDRYIVVPDQRGHGESGRPGGEYSMQRLAEDALELAAAVGATRVTVVGHSMGSFVARCMATLAPDRVGRLLLLAAGDASVNDTIRELRAAVDALGEPVDPGFVREFQESTVHRPLPKEFMDLVIRESLKMPARIWKAALAGLMDYQPAHDRIRCPTFVLGGDRDAVFSVAEQTSLADQISRSRLELVPDVGHALHWEDPRAFVRALLDFAA